MDSIDKLTELFRHFPGIGPRQAKRFVYFLLNEPASAIQELVLELQALKQSIATCPECFRYFPISEIQDDNGLCSICRNPARDRSTLMVVSRDIDLQAMEKSRAFSGIYFVLGGAVPLLEERPEDKVRGSQLVAEVEKKANQTPRPLKEIIVATNLNPEGEHTAAYIAQILLSKTKEYSIKVSTLGRGLSTGTELEYSDSDTIKSALENRR
ncbi:MAG: recombination protein RecR, recombination protein RecR [Candidatus Parcubacteria bacterium]|jgi:recombination protein RecR